MAINLKRHFKVILVLYRFWFMRILEFRAEVISWSILSIMWGFTGFFVAELIFGQVNSIAGWNKNQVLILVAVQAIFDSTMWAFIFPSILSFAGTIQNGKLDFYLLKPINARFLLSFSKFEFDNYPRLIVMSLLLVYLLIGSSVKFSILSTLEFFSLMLMGFFIFYCLFFAIATTSFWFIRFFNLEDFLQILISVGRYPTYVFKGGARFLFFNILPIVFVATFPVQALLGKVEAKLFIVGLILCLLFFVVSQFFWNFALKNYSSASS